MSNDAGSIHVLIETQVLRTPTAIAIEFEGEFLTYAELNHQSNQLAQYLQQYGAEPGKLIGICVDRSLLLFVALLAVLKTGAAYIPLDPDYPQDRLEYMLNDADALLVLTESHLVPDRPYLQNRLVFCLDTHRDVIQQQSADQVRQRTKPEDLAYVIYTSGSTGQPKGVEVRHQSVVNLLQSLAAIPGCGSQDRMLCLSTICFDMVVPELYLPLTVGGRIVLAKRQLATDPVQLGQVLQERQITIMQATPTLWQLLMTSGWQGSSRLKMWCGGEALLPPLANQLLVSGRELWNLYGPTETTVWSAAYRVEAGVNPGLIGTAIDQTQIYLLSPSEETGELRRSQVGETGEVYIGGIGLARGYRNRSALTQEKFVSHPFSADPAARLYKTGDLACYLPDSTIKFMGRADHQIKVRGFRVELGEIEATLMQSPLVEAAAVVAHREADDRTTLAAYVVPNSLQQPSSSDRVNDTGMNSQVDQWQNVWNTTYRHTSDQQDPLFNSTGWNDSYTGLPMPVDEVQEWVTHTVERILELRPRRVLEIGCGMGLLLFRVAPCCDRYVGVDISAYALYHIQRQLSQNPSAWSHVHLAQKAAHELDDFEPASFDTIVLNSVIQYFPSVDYLVQVLEKASTLLKPGGRIFIGDVRCLSLLETIQTSIHLRQGSTGSTALLRQRIQDAIVQERELLIDPGFFAALRQAIPRINHVETLIKRGRSQNELIRFRYDALLHVETEVKPITEITCLDWQQDSLSLSQVSDRLQTQTIPLKITGIPDARILAEVQATQRLDDPTIESVEQLTEEHANTGVHPEDWWELGQAQACSVKMQWSDPASAGLYEVILQPQTEKCCDRFAIVVSTNTPSLQSWRQYANAPNRAIQKPQLIAQLRSFLQEKLPPYMVPDAFLVLDALPLTPSSKIDRQALPQPQKDRPALATEFAAPSNPLEQQLAEIWSQVLGLSNLGIYDNFFDLGGHSLLSVQLLSQIKTVLHVDIPLFDLLQNPTIHSLSQSIDRLRTGEAIDQPKTDLASDLILAPSISVEAAGSSATRDIRSIFLTGATGFLGAFLLHDLLMQTDATVYCLVRAQEPDAGMQRIRANLQHYQLWHENLKSRIVPICGDLGQLNFGLTSDQFQALAEQLDVIYHCGAFVNLVYPYEALKLPNVLGTQEILKLASIHRPVPVHHISTLDVFQPTAYSQLEALYEDSPLLQDNEFFNGYAQSKWVAEQLVLAARDRGIPVSIYRLGMITGHSQSGISQTNDLMCRLIKGIIQMEAAPTLDCAVSMLPVNYVSQAIVKLSQQAASLNRSFHFVNPQPLPLRELVEHMQSLGYRVKALPFEQWQARLLNLDVSQHDSLFPLSALLSQKDKHDRTYLEVSLWSSQIFDCQNTAGGLRGTSVSCPAVNAKLLQTYFAYFSASGFLCPSLASV